MTDEEISAFWKHIDEMATNAPEHPYSHVKAKPMTSYKSDNRIPEGPYFVTADDAEDTIDHRHSGLAKVDTGRSGDWPIARLCEWPTAQMIASIPEMLTSIATQCTVIDGLAAVVKAYRHERGCVVDHRPGCAHVDRNEPCDCGLVKLDKQANAALAKAKGKT